MQCLITPQARPSAGSLFSGSLSSALIHYGRWKGQYTIILKLVSVSHLMLENISEQTFVEGEEGYQEEGR